MAHTINNKAKLLTRIRRIRGQAEGLEKALRSEGECMAILQQIAAIRGAVNGLMTEVLEGHLREHLGSDTSDLAARARDLDNVVAVLRSYLK